MGTQIQRAAAHLGAGEVALSRGDRNAAATHLHAALEASQAVNLGRFLPRIEQLVGLLRNDADEAVPSPTAS